MKKINLLFALSILLLISCSGSDDNSASIDTSSLVGKWDLKAKMRGTTPIALYPCEEQYNEVQFFGNLTYIEDEGYTNNGTECRHYTYNNTYSISNDVIIIKDNDGSIQTETHSKIIELTPTKLKLKTFYYKSKENGVVIDEMNIPESEQGTSSFDKI